MPSVTPSFAAESFENVTTRVSTRGHDVHIGTLNGVDVGCCSTGMGCPSVDIIVTELIKLGGKRFLRIGSSGSVQPNTIRVGSVVVATAAVRDEGTSRCYAPMEVPAVASPLMVQAAIAAAKELGMADTTYAGLVHSKDSLYAREFHEGCMVAENMLYMQTLQGLGVVASEMEASMLFMLASVHTKNRAVPVSGNGSANTVQCGTILGVIGDAEPFAPADKVAEAMTNAMKLAMQTLQTLAAMEKEAHGV